MRLFFASCAFMAVSFFCAPQLHAQKLPFQGRLLENGVPVNASLSFTFSIDTLWSETHEGVVVSEGLYDVVLGSINPLPEDLFQSSLEHPLSISVNGTPLSPVTIYAPLSSKTGSANQRKFIITGEEAKGDTAVYYEINGGADSLSYSGVLSLAKSAGVNIGVRGNATSVTGNDNYQVGTWGRASGEGSAYHYGVIGQASSTGINNIGVLGSASGAGNGYTGYDSGSYNTGLSGSASNNAWGNSGVFGNVTGPTGVDNLGVVGWSSAGGETTENKGVLGWAKGVGINKGVVGMATGGVENWAGWFEGNMALVDTSYNKRIQLNSNAGNIIGRGSNNSINWLMSGIGNGGNYGSFSLRDSSGLAKVWGQVTPLSDGSAYGLFTLQGPSQGAIQGGFRGWESDSLVNLPWLTFEGNIEHKSLIWMEVSNNADTGHEFGSVRFESTEDNRNIQINPTEIIFNGPNKPNIQIGAKVWESPDLGMIAIKDSTWANLVGFEASQNEHGLFGEGRFNTNRDARSLHLNPSGYTLNGPERTAMGVGLRDWEDSNLPFLHMYDSSNAPILLMEPRVVGSSLEGTLELKSSLDQRNININGSFFNLNGPSSQNVEMGSVYWDEANGGLERGFISVKGLSEQTLIHMRGDYNSGLARSAGFLEVTDEVYDGYIQMHSLADTLSSLKVGMFSSQTSVELRGNGDIYHSGQIFGASDRRYKENISTLEGSLVNTLRLRGVSYNWKDRRSSSLQIGLIAQEVEEVYPEFVHTNEDGMKSVNYAQMVAVLIEAVKELNTKVEQLKNKNISLSRENSTLKAQLDSEMEALKSRMQQLEVLLSGGEVNISTDSSTATNNSK